MKANFETGLKVCSKCKKELPLNKYHSDRTTENRLELLKRNVYDNN